MSGRRITLFSALRHSHMTTMGFAAGVAGVLLALVAFFALRASVHANAELVSRSIAYAVEAAVVFGDKDTTEEILTSIARRERLTEAQITTPSGGIFVRYFHQPDNRLTFFDEALERLVFPERVRENVIFDDRIIATVELRGDSAVFVNFLFKTLLAILICLALVLVTAGRIARRTEQGIVAKLDAFAGLSRSLRLSGGFSGRLPAFDLVEFDELGKDFNALLQELEASRIELVNRQRMLENANASLSHLALHDSLTGLANRAYFNEQLSHTLKHARRDKYRLGVLFLDCDGFKQINDNFGHAAGDTLLITLAQRIQAAIRDTDFVARLGGDEFAVLLAPIHNLMDARLVADKMLAALVQPGTIAEGVTVTPSVSIGIALFPEHGDSSDELLRAADNAMYLAKNNGRGCYHVFNPEEFVPAGSAV